MKTKNGSVISLVRFCAVATAGVGVAVLAGWAFDIAALKTVLPGYVTMKANTAFCFLMSGLALWLSVSSRQDQATRLARVIAVGAVALVATATILEYASGWSLGIDHWLVRDPGGLGGQAIPGRMSIVTAIEFALFASALLFARAADRRAEIAFVTIATAGATLSLLAVVGYAYSVPVLYQPTKAAAIALHTGAAFLALFIGVLALRPDLGWVRFLGASGEGGVFMRRLLPMVVAAPLLLGLVALGLLRANVFDAATAVAIFALANVVVLGAILWMSAASAASLQRTLHRREQIFASFLENALDAMIIADQHGRVIEWNPQAERTFGRSRADMTGKIARDYVWPEEQRDGHRTGLAALRGGGEYNFVNRRVETDMLRADGARFPAEVIIVPVELDGELMLCSFVRDLTEAKAAEDRLRQAQKMEAVGQLTGGIAHDFNNLLSVVLLMLDSVMDRVDDNVRKRLTLVLQAAERGATLVRQMLAFSRRQVLTPTAINLSDVSTGLEDMLRRTLGEQIEIDLRLDADLPATMADLGQVENALLNLSINARDAMPNGGKLTIETRVVDLDAEYARQNLEVLAGRYVMLAVSDTGGGMSPPVLQRATEPFFSTKDVGKGSGLGLSMIHGFARQSNGHLKIYSEEGHGTSVRLYLPLIEAQVSAGGRTPQGAAPTARAGETVLVVEDDPAVREAAVLHLKSLGYAVMEAQDAASALEVLAASDRVDLLFTDVVMPGGVTGRELAGSAQALRPDLLVLFTSGYTENTIVHHGQLDADVQFLPKPYRLADLAHKVRAVLDDAQHSAATRRLLSGS